MPGSYEFFLTSGFSAKIQYAFLISLIQSAGPAAPTVPFRMFVCFPSAT